MTSPEPTPARLRSVGLVVLLVALAQSSGRSWAQDPKPDKAAGVFDDEKTDAKPADVKPVDPKAAAPKAVTKDKDKPAPKPNEKDKPAAGSAADRDVIGFTQQNATSQMTELEERMFRLSEALRGLEPENASRLRLALKFSREELILEQMRETNKLLKDAELNKAETEVRELLAKLEHLRDVLLAEDLDFQLKIARLRQLRETLNQLDRVVKEERRQLGWSRFAIDQRKAKEKLVATRPSLADLARDQQAIMADTKALSPEGDAVERKSARSTLREREGSLGKASASLALNPIFADFQSSELRKVDSPVSEAASQLDGDDLTAAVTAEEKAATLLQNELQGLDKRIAETDRDVSQPEFRRHEADQARNRRASEVLGTSSARLGDTGVALQKDLIRAGAAMQSAERDLNRSEADPAANEQSTALDILARSADDLASAAEKLLVELRTELQHRLNAELAEMHEAQALIRENTAAQAPKLAQKSRTAAIAVAGLAQKEADLAVKTETLLGLVEETEYGIALPTTLRILAREMHTIEGWLKETDASPRTIALEQRVEDDLLALIQAIRRLPPTNPPAPGSPLPSDLRERERELNRLISELKMIRLLQSRLNDDTVGVDKGRPNPSDLPPALRREVEALESSQEEIRDSLAKIAERIEQPQ